MKVPFELEWMGGAPEHHFRAARPGTDDLPWGTLDATRYAPATERQAAGYPRNQGRLAGGAGYLGGGHRCLDVLVRGSSMAVAMSESRIATSTAAVISRNSACSSG